MRPIPDIAFKALQDFRLLPLRSFLTLRTHHHKTIVFMTAPSLAFFGAFFLFFAFGPHPCRLCRGDGGCSPVCLHTGHEVFDSPLPLTYNRAVFLLCFFKRFYFHLRFVIVVVAPSHEENFLVDEFFELFFLLDILQSQQLFAPVIRVIIICLQP